MFSTIIILILALSYLCLVAYNYYVSARQNRPFRLNILILICSLLLIVACVISLKTGRSLGRIFTPDDVFQKYEEKK